MPSKHIEYRSRCNPFSISFSYNIAEYRRATTALLARIELNVQARHVLANSSSTDERASALQFEQRFNYERLMIFSPFDRNLEPSLHVCDQLTSAATMVLNVTRARSRRA